MKTVGLISALALMMAALSGTAWAQTATGTGTSNSTSNSGSSSAAQGVVGPGGSNSIIGSNANSGSNSNSNSSSATRSSSNGNATNQNINFNSPGDTRSNNTNNTSVSGGTNNRDNVNYSGGTSNWNGGDQTIRTTPTVYAPPVSGGNPCTLAVSGGVSVIGWGAAAGGTFVDQDCANRQAIAMVHNAGYAAEAREMMCNDKPFYFAARSVGKPCAWRPAFEGGAPAPQQPMVQQQPSVVTPITSPVITGPTPTATRATLPRCSRTITDNCYSG